MRFAWRPARWEIVLLGVLSVAPPLLAAVPATERAALIANTEIRRANSAGSLAGYKEARTAGVDIKKEWLLGSEPCDECEENAAQGPIDLDDAFASGDDEPPAHPNCNCTVSPVVDSGDGETEEDQDE